jgi:hypothetical protein
MTRGLSLIKLEFTAQLNKLLYEIQKSLAEKVGWGLTSKGLHSSDNLQASAPDYAGSFGFFTLTSVQFQALADRMRPLLSEIEARCRGREE